MNTKNYSWVVPLIILMVVIIIAVVKTTHPKRTEITQTSPMQGYVRSAYQYQALGPGKDIYGIKYTIPVSLATGTNLSTDSYISIERLPKTTPCSASLFLGYPTTPDQVTANGITYSVANTSDAAAGNRYEETVYAIPGTDPCTAIRYFIHYGAIANYTDGTKEFDKVALLKQFDAIRDVLAKQ